MSMPAIPVNCSRASWVASLPEATRRRWIQSLSPAEAEALTYSWGFWARPQQLSPWSPQRGREARLAGLARWSGALVLAGRGFGKTRMGGCSTNEEAEADPQMRAALIGRTAADVRDVMIEGESGILQTSRPDFRPTYEPSKRRLTWPNGAQATTYSADTPDQLRGPQHTWAWADEVAAWPYRDTWDQVQFGLRLGAHPRWMATTTPRPTSLIRELLKDPRVLVVRGSTYDNASNLAPDFLAKMRARYEGTTLGRQELYAEVFDEAPGALWKRAAMLDAHRVKVAPPLHTIVVAVDPAVTATEESDETGIVTAGIGGDPAAPHGYTLADDSGRYTPDGWATAALTAYHRHRADRIVAEANQGGDMVADVLRHRDLVIDGRTVLRGRDVPITLVHASRGKLTRAEPVAGLYEQGRVHHVGMLAALEDQLCQWVPGHASPDRLDALVWAYTALIVDGYVYGSASPHGPAHESILGTYGDRALDMGNALGDVYR